MTDTTTTRVLVFALRAIAVGWCSMCALLFGSITLLSQDLETVCVCGVATTISVIAGCYAAIES